MTLWQQVQAARDALAAGKGFEVGEGGPFRYFALNGQPIALRVAPGHMLRHLAPDRRDVLRSPRIWEYVRCCDGYVLEYGAMEARRV